jgi:DNA repair protein RecN (Recombination protein N)
VLTWLHIKDFAIADQIELDLGEGLNVITGETGAGKSIIIKALGLVLGQRADPGVVKHGCKRAEIQASFDIASCKAVSELLTEQDLDEEDECQLRRVINAKSGSKAYINGRMVSVSILRQVGEQLMDIHGQNEHQSLLRADTQRELLDKYAGISEQVRQLTRCYQTLQQRITQLTQLRSDFASAHEKLDFLKYQVDELSRFAPLADEWTNLYTNHQRIHHQAELAAFVQNAELALLGTEQGQASLSSQLGYVIAELERAQAIDPGFKDISELLCEARTLLIDSESGLHHAVESVSFDEGELEQIEQRYAAYMEFARKHRVEPEQLYETFQELLAALETAENPEQSEQVHLDEIHSLSKQYVELADTISQKRALNARKLSIAITQAMQSLAMEGGQFDIVLQAVPPGFSLSDCETELSGVGRETGRESVNFEVSTNTGMPGLPLSRVASGGELSRISLAIQLILSDLASVNSLVFDEVDVGVGGKTAAIIGKMLAQLAQSRQILCITHLPQVAAYGTWHYRVNKQQGKQVQLSIEALDEAGKIAEIARMAGGEKLSDESLSHARSLISDSTVT